MGRPTTPAAFHVAKQQRRSVLRGTLGGQTICRCVTPLQTLAQSLTRTPARNQVGWTRYPLTGSNRELVRL